MAQHSPPTLLPRGSVPLVNPGVRGFPWLLYGTGTPSGLFPTQYAGLRYFKGTVRELCLVAEGDAPTGMGGVWKIRKGGVDYAVYLVETSDPNASHVRVQTTTGIKAARLKT